MSGLIYAMILGAWAAVLIPMWLRRHDEAVESRSVERFSTAMRVLARREPRLRPDQRYVVMPARDRTAEISVSGADSPVRAPRHAGRARLAARRRRLVAALVLGTAVLALLAAFGVLRWAAAAGSLVGLVAYLVHLRLQARRAQELARRRRAVHDRVASRARRTDSAERVVAVRRTREQELDAARAAAAAARAEAQRIAAEQAEAERRRAEGWEPVPVPLPTYVTKPKAPRAARTIDLGPAGAWTDSAWTDSAETDSAAGAGAAAAVPGGATAAGLDAPPANPYDEEIDALVDRRAVND